MSIDLEQCEGAAYHAPAPMWTERHHIYPKYLCALLGLPVVEEVVPLCGNCHARVHHALHHLINTGENPHRLSQREMVLLTKVWFWWMGGLLDGS